MFARRLRAISLLGVVVVAAPLLFTLAAGADDPNGPIPAGPGVELTLLSKTTTSDPVEIKTSGSSEIEFAQVSVDPDGTTGLLAHSGTVVVSVHRGVATILSDGERRCASRAVNAGFAFVQPRGTVSEIRNEGSAPLELYATSLTPAGFATSMSARGVSCPMSPSGGVTSKVLNRSVIKTSLAAESKGSSDVYVALVRVQPGAATAWHTHPRAVLFGVEEGQLTIPTAHDGQCQVVVFPTRTGGIELPDMVHQGQNEGTSPVSFYFLALAPSPQPFLTPSPPPAECQSQRRGMAAARA